MPQERREGDPEGDVRASAGEAQGKADNRCQGGSMLSPSAQSNRRQDMTAIQGDHDRGEVPR